MTSNMNDFFLMNLWRRSAGLPEIEKSDMSYENLRRTQWSDDFERKMRNRLIMGALRYGLMKSPDKPQYDRMTSIQKKVELYKQTGNDEYLVDIANCALLEYEEGGHPLKHFRADDDKNHTQIL